VPQAGADGYAWALVKKNENEAVAEQVAVDQLSKLDRETSVVLKFHRISQDIKEGRSQLGTRSRKSSVSMARSQTSSSKSWGVRFGMTSSQQEVRTAPL
jgi:hypothetical protein